MLGNRLYYSALNEVSKKKPDIPLVLELLEKAISKNNSRAKYALGTWYLQGKYVKKILKKPF